jgi:predicted TIM-barrel fold metal-dependent hydrolase
MMIADAQVHIWRPSTPEHPWPAGLKPQRAEPLGIEELLREMDGAGVERAVLVPPRIEGGRNDYSLQAARRYPDRFAVMGKLDPDAPDAPQRLADWKSAPGMLGLRFTLKHKLAPVLTEGRMEWVWAAAEKHGLPLYVAIVQADAHLIHDVAVRFPKLRLVLDHLAIASDKEKDEQAFAGLHHVIELAALPNVAVKVTTMPNYTTDVYPYRRLHPYLQRVHRAFGPRRMFWGSDLSRLRGSYRQCVTMFTEEMPWLPQDDLGWIMGAGLCEWLGWKRASH